MRPACAALLSFILVVSGAFSPALASINTQSNKYAAFIINSDTGEVLYSRNGDTKRYPASLTKMMTLYLLFEAMRDGKMNLNQKMHVSPKAASQPQTNISLRAGQTIPVEDAIKALVVRSANDVAVVVAEALAGSEWRFAQEMTNKARQLGMKSTVFRNPHGLPDVQQYTTARDMARLSIALRRDFPQYYHYFKTQSFTWKGTTYNSHNRVMGRYQGADGLKTGYINMSGFNLATSVKRDGYNMVGIVMGGQSGGIRDNHMIALLDQTFTRLAQRGDQPMLVAEAPIPVAKPALASADETMTETAAVGMGDRVEIPAARRLMSQPRGFSIANVSTPKDRETVVSSPAASAENIVKSSLNAPPMTLQYQMAKLQQSSASAADRSQSARDGWGIQVGAYTDAQSAARAALKAQELAGEHLKDSQVIVTDKDRASTSIHRARLSNLSEYQARRACQALVSNNKQCFVYRADSQRNL